MGTVPRTEVADSDLPAAACEETWFTQSKQVTRGRVLLACLLAAGGLMAPNAAPAAAPSESTGLSEKQALSEEIQQVPTDARVVQQLQQLEQHVRGGRISEIRDLLRLLSLSDATLLMPWANTAPELHHIWEPLHRVKFRTVHGLAPDQLSELRREQDPLASAALSRAMTEGRMETLVGVIHDFPGCDASYRAHLLLARAHLDRGNLLAAMSWLQPLLLPGVPQNWKLSGQAALQRLQQGAPRAPAAAAKVPGSAESPVVSPPIDNDTTSVSSSLPTQLHWQHAPPLSPLLRDSVDRLVTSARRTGVIPWTSWAPVSDETRIFSRTVRGIAALDRWTGHPVWYWTSLADADVALQQLAERGLQDTTAFPGSDPEAVFASLDRSAVCNLLNRNGVTGRMTSDAERLFLVEDQGVGVGVSAGTRLLRWHDVAGNVPSELIALDKATGRRVWTAGGDPIEAVFENDLTAAWIAGPPTVSGAKLLIVIEQQDVILLACLSAETGRLLWKIPLVYPVTPAGQDPARRITAAVPAVRGGLIWSTTTTGWMVAVDSLTQSVVWAHRTRRQAEPADASRAGRGRVLGARPHASLRESWPVHSPVVAGTQLIVFPNDARDLLVLDAIRGVLKHRVPVSAHRLALFADAQRVVLAGTESIQAWSTADASLLWTTARQSPDCLPTGTAIIRHGRLVVPMSDGTLHSLDPATGQIEEIRSLPRSAPAWGGLSAAGDDVLSFSPREILMYSNAASKVSPATLSEQAETLLRQDDAAGARKLLEAADVTVGEESSIRRLRFRVLSLLADADDQAPVTPDELESLAVSGPEHARVLQHRIHTHIRSGRRDEAADLALNTLKESDSVQRHPVATDSGVQPLRTWLLTRLDAWLDDSDEPFRRRAREFVRQQPTEILLGLQHPVAGAELLSRLENDGKHADPEEQSIHMVLQAVKTMSNTGTETDTDTASSGADDTSQPRDSADADPLKRAEQVLKHWMDRLADDSVGEPDSIREPDSVEPHRPGLVSAWTELRLQLLRAVVRELQQGRTASAAGTRPVTQESAPPTDIVAGNIVAGDTAFPGEAAWKGSTQLAERWSRWSDGPYTPVPVSQFVSFRQSEKMLIPLTEADPFLNDSDWQWLRTPRLLKAVSGGGSGTEAWSVSCAVNDLTPYSVSANGIDRLGSVVLIRTSHAISGISVMDQRTLWHRRFPPAWSEPRTSPNSRPRTSARDSLMSTPAADLVNAAAYRVCGASPRWLCLQSRSGLEVLDLLTGEPHWSLPDNGEQSQAFATGRVVVTMDGETRSVRALRTSDGTAVTSAVTPEMFERTLLATAHELVLLRAPASDGDSHLLEWVEPVSGDVVRRLYLHDVRSFQFLDPATLAAVAADEFQIVRLVSGESLTYPLWNSAVSGTPLAPGERTASLPADGPGASIPAKSPLPSRPVLPPQKFLPPGPGDPEAASAEAAETRLMVFADPVNFYVFPRFLSSRTFDLRFLGRELIPVDGPIRAIDRLTGQLRWVASSDAPIIATFDQPLAPILLLIQLEPPGPPGVPGAVPLPRVSFRGILKTTGSTLFEHRLSSRYPLPFVRLLADPDAGIDIEAFGSRVRFVADHPR